MNTQVEKAWQDEGSGEVPIIALSPDGKKVASRSEDGAVKLWMLTRERFNIEHTRGLWLSAGVQTENGRMVR
jgi:WD40 repeat protein